MRARLDEMIQKWGKEKFIFHVIIPATHPFWWKFYWLKYLCIQYAWISIMKKQNSNQNVKVEKMEDGSTIQNFWPLSSQFSTFPTVL